MNGHEPVNKFISYLGEDGSRAHKYWNFSGAWCCGEVAMVMKQTVGNLFYDGKKVVYCPTAYAWCKTHLQKIPTRNAQFGDIIFFDWNKNGVPDHIGMVEYVEGTTVHTLEGNTGSPARVRRRVRESYILGVFRPKYEPPKPEDYIVSVDGEWGYHTCLGTQYVLGGLTLDGVLGKATVKAIQKKVGAKVDGGWGKDTTLNMQKFLNTNGITDMNGKKLVEDGEKGKATISAWQKWVNSQIVPEPQPYGGDFPDLVTHSGQKIYYTAINLAYAKGTSKSKYTYPKGKAKDTFTKAINKVYPKRSSWSKQCQAGASCDVGVGTVVRASGYDTKYPRGLGDEQIPWVKKHPEKWKLTGIKKGKDMKAGDIGQTTSGGHTWISLGGTLIAEANHTAKYFLHIVSKAINSGSYKTYNVYRACGTSAIAMGDKGTEVTKLQKFLNWAGFDCGTADGDFGEKTLGAVKNFQYKVGLTADGEFGNTSLAKAKEFNK